MKALSNEIKRATTEDLNNRVDGLAESIARMELSKDFQTASLYRQMMTVINAEIDQRKTQPHGTR